MCCMCVILLLVGTVSLCMVTSRSSAWKTVCTVDGTFVVSKWRLFSLELAVTRTETGQHQFMPAENG